MSVTQQTFEELALANPKVKWELHEGRPREKPGMSISHNRIAVRLGYQLWPQLDLDRFDLRFNAGHLRRIGVSSYVPNFSIIPVGSTEPLPTEYGGLETFDQPLPLVVEIWSPSTGDYDVDAKIPEYLRRGDLEVWRLHPYDKTLTAWVRRPDGTYDEVVHRGGVVHLSALPGVTVDLDALLR